MKKILLLAIATIGIGGTMQSKDITITPGGLKECLPELTTGETELKLNGEADARDLSLIRSLPAGVVSLDFSGLRIAPFTDNKPEYFNRTYFEENQIPPFCFFNVKAEEIKLPTKATIIGKGAFAGSLIKRAEIPGDVKEIEDYAYYDCPNLISVSLPEGLTKLGKGAFANNPQLRVADLSNTAITEIPEGCFAGCSSLVKVILPSNLKKIGREAFRGTVITDLELSDVAILEPYALSGMYNLREVVLNPEGVSGEGVLMDNARLVSLKGAPKELPSHFAANCVELDPQSSMQNAYSIGDYAFANTQATALILSNDLTKIDTGIFHGSENLKSIEAIGLGSNIPAVEEESFSGLNCGEIELHVSNDSYDAWKNHPQWGLFNVVSDTSTGIESIGEGITGNDIMVSASRGIIRVSASEPLTLVEIYSTDGRKLHVSTPEAMETEIDMSGSGEKILIVVGRTLSSSKSVKVLGSVK